MAERCELILVTGFLGAGKTTLLQSLLRLYAGKRIHLIVNEFGLASVDGALLADLGASLDEIVNGSIFCACRLDQFEAALDEAQRRGADMLFVESSGLSDPTAIRTLLEQGTRYQNIHYRGCIALADATRLFRVIDTARVCHRQLSVADLILLTKTDIATAEQTAQAEALLIKRYPDVPILHAVQGALAKETVDALSTDRPPQPDSHTRDLSLQKYALAISPAMRSEQLHAFLRMFAEDTSRIKGLVRLADGDFHVDCVGAYVNVKPFSGTQTDNRLAVLSGERMQVRTTLKQAIAWYRELVKETGLEE